MTTFFISVLAFLMMLFPSCEFLQLQYQAVTYNRMEAYEKVKFAFEARDVEALEAIMCKKMKDSIPDISAKIQEMYDQFARTFL
jgi:predicted secreted Zn-dependent protease